MYKLKIFSSDFIQICYQVKKSKFDDIIAFHIIYTMYIHLYK